MKPAYKLILIVLIIVVFIYLTSHLLADKLSLQFLILLVVTVFSVVRFKLQKLLAEFKLILPFVVSMLLVYSLFGLLGKNYAPEIIRDVDIFMFWMLFGIEKCLLFVSTFLFLQVALSYVAMNDILNLPMQMQHKKYLVLGRALFVHAFNNINNLEFHLQLIPDYQKKKLSLKQWFKFKIQLTLAVVTMILRESKIKGEFIDNRIDHCFPDD